MGCWAQQVFRVLVVHAPRPSCPGEVSSVRDGTVGERRGGLDVGAVDGGAFGGRERSGDAGGLIADPEEGVALVDTFPSCPVAGA